MSYFLIGVLIVALFAFFMRQLATADVKKLAKNIRKFAALALILLGVFMAFIGRWAFSIPLFALAFGLIRRQLPGLGGYYGQRPASGQTSSVSSRHLEMHLNHDTGDMDGEILTGTHSGRRLSSLSLGDLLDFVKEIDDDEESRSLMLAYMDRRFPGWREDDDQQEDTTGRQGPMTSQEALAILGLENGATPTQIRAAHRKLMKKLHPDQGGSTYFATKLNEARDLLLP
jgi:DnaJ domain